MRQRQHISYTIFFNYIDQSRVSKTLYTNNPRGVPMSVITPQNSEDEANFVAAEIKKTIRNSKGLIQYKDIAVLMRMNFISRAFESTFRLNKIPFTMVKIIFLLLKKKMLMLFIGWW